MDEKAEHFRKKLDQALRELRARKVASRGAIAPPLWRWSWRLGLRIPPPHFLSFPACTLLLGFPIAFGVLLLSWLWPASMPKYLPVAVAIPVLIGGLVVRWQAWCHELPRWRDYHVTDEDAFS